MRVELKLRVQEALNSMDANDREVLILRHFEELTNAEAAQVARVSPDGQVRILAQLPEPAGGATRMFRAGFQRL